MRAIEEDNQRYIGNNSLKWANFVLKNVKSIDYKKIDQTLNRQFNRYDLLDYCNNHHIDNLNAVIAILSWGGMRRDHGKLLFKKWNNLNPLIINLREGFYHSRKIAFEAFQELRNGGFLTGLGIGFFTKLICFLYPKLNGYIMDQWTGKSINLLSGKNIVKITNDQWVNDNNDAEIYEQFCEQIDSLGVLLKCTGFEAEEKIFSVGRKKGLWRNYLIKTYLKKT